MAGLAGWRRGTCSTSRQQRGATYKYTHGHAGLPVIETVTRTSGTSVAKAYITHDPTGQPVFIQTSTGTVARRRVLTQRAPPLSHPWSRLGALLRHPGRLPANS